MADVQIVNIINLFGLESDGDFLELTKSWMLDAIGCKILVYDFWRIPLSAAGRVFEAI